MTVDMTRNGVAPGADVVEGWALGCVVGSPAEPSVGDAEGPPLGAGVAAPPQAARTTVHVKVTASRGIEVRARRA